MTLVVATLFVALLGCSAPSAAQVSIGRGAVPPNFTPPVAVFPSGLTANARQQAQIDATVTWDINHMSLDEKLGQMFLIESTYQTDNYDTDAMVTTLHAGAMIVYAQNMKNPTQLKTFLSALQSHAAIPMMISMDEEGGGVDRLGTSNFAPPIPSAAVMAQGSTSTIRAYAAREAAQMLSFGINTDLAPVADVQGAPDAIEWDRLFSDDPSTVERDAGAFLQGIQQNGVIGTLKHWPGIGSITADPHLTLPTLNHSEAQLNSTDFATFKALLADDPGMIMVTHVMVPVYDTKYPATLSPTLVDGILRGQLGYDGVVMTDSLYMKAIADTYTLPQAGVLSIEAGDDLLEGAFDSYSMAAMIAAIKSAMSAGKITQTRINQSVRRILSLKARFGLLPLLGLTHGPIQGTSAQINGISDAESPRRF